MLDAPVADSFVKLTIAPDPGLAFSLETMEAAEELGRAFLIVLDVSSEKPNSDTQAVLGSSATIELAHPTKPTRYYNGIVARVSYRGLTGGSYRYRLELRPWLWLLSHQQDCRIFSTKSPWTIMTGLFRDAGFTDFVDKRQGGAGDLVLDYCVQYRESTFDFVTRLMEQYGLYYFVAHKNGSHVVTFADDPNSHTSVGPAIPYRYDGTDWRTAIDHVWDWSSEAMIQPGAYTLREYNFTTPKADLTAKSLIPGPHSHGGEEVYDYPGRYETAGDGRTAAQVRMQDLEIRRQFFSGTCNSRAIGAGDKFTLSDHPDPAANQEYLVISTVCSVERGETRQSSSDDEIVDTYRCVVRAVPGSRPFKLANQTPRPLIRGPQTAVVAGEAGQEITTDKYGRIKVKFPWDRREPTDENSSCWIRVAQISAGTSFGAMFIPRIGQEVVVEFLEGDPDRPLVTGQVYNADVTVPYPLPANKTRSTFKSNSSLGGGGSNELRFEDKKHSEEVFFQAQKDYNVVVLNDKAVVVHHDYSETVQTGNRTITIASGTHTETIKGNTTIRVTNGNLVHRIEAGTAQYFVSGNVVENYNDHHATNVYSDINITSIYSKIFVQAALAIQLTTGASQITLDKDGTITIIGKNIRISGSESVRISGADKAEIDSGKEAKIGVGSQNTVYSTEKVSTSGAAISAAAIGEHDIAGAIVKIN